MSSCHSLFVFPITDEYIQQWRPILSQNDHQPLFYQIMVGIFSNKTMIRSHLFFHKKRRIQIQIHKTSIDHLPFIAKTLLAPSYATVVSIMSFDSGTQLQRDRVSRFDVKGTIQKTSGARDELSRIPPKHRKPKVIQIILAKLANGNVFLLDNANQKMIELSSCDDYYKKHHYNTVSFIELHISEKTEIQSFGVTDGATLSYHPSP